LLFERVLGYANHLGLYAEQIGRRGEALGNFPQAFTHLALISAAFNLDRMLGSQVLTKCRKRSPRSPRKCFSDRKADLRYFEKTI